MNFMGDFVYFEAVFFNAVIQKKIHKLKIIYLHVADQKNTERFHTNFLDETFNATFFVQLYEIVVAAFSSLSVHEKVTTQTIQLQKGTFNFSQNLVLNQIQALRTFWNNQICFDQICFRF